MHGHPRDSYIGIAELAFGQSKFAAPMEPPGSAPTAYQRDFYGRAMVLSPGSPPAERSRKRSSRLISEDALSSLADVCVAIVTVFLGVAIGVATEGEVARRALMPTGARAMLSGAKT
mmetsp:Transcript_127431/g.302781  ORF Transcript_127431/g.302781 Transcript_127431/m.302781 type:complete len:117 (-) Transcript_127431:856-1206(-)